MSENLADLQALFAETPSSLPIEQVLTVLDFWRKVGREDVEVLRRGWRLQDGEYEAAASAALGTTVEELVLVPRHQTEVHPWMNAQLWNSMLLRLVDPSADFYLQERIEDMRFLNHHQMRWFHSALRRAVTESLFREINDHPEVPQVPRALQAGVRRNLWSTFRLMLYHALRGNEQEFEKFAAFLRVQEGAICLGRPFGTDASKKLLVLTG